MSIKISGGVKVPQGKFSVYTPPPPSGPSLWVWGRGLVGQLGLGDDGIDRSSPVQIGSLLDWSDVSMNLSSTAFVTKTDGTLWSWGNNAQGQVGDGTIVNKSSPVQIGSLTDWSSTSGGSGIFHTATAKADGTLWVWGRNQNGQLGLGNVNYRSSPVQVAGTDWASVAVGGGHTLALKTDGSIWTWGSNSNGRLGLNDVANRSSPVQVGGLTTWASVGAGQDHSLAIKTNGSLWVWGNGSPFGNLGLGDVSINRSSPVQVGALLDWANASGTASSSFAIKTDGTLWGWGYNNGGGLGIGTATSVSSPVQVGSLSDWSKFGFSSVHGVAIKTDGSLWSWGKGNNGRTGHGDTVNRSSPVQVGSDTNWIDVAAGATSTFAIKDI